MAKELPTTTVKFKSAEDIYDRIHSGVDLYDLTAGIYLFDYNDAGAIASYDISKTDMIDLIRKADEIGDFVSGLLGPGGSIIDMKLKSPDGDVIEHDDDEWDEAFCNSNYSRDPSDIYDYLKPLVEHNFVELSDAYEHDEED